MTAPLINLLQQQHPELKITLRTTVPLPFLKRKFCAPFEYLPQSSDIGMIMHSPFTVDRPGTLHAYQQLHAEWHRHVDLEMQALIGIGAEMVISNIAYLPLIAARQLNIPAIAIGCLNWADLFNHFFPDENSIHEQITSAYQSADHFIRTEPAMPMPRFATQTVAPTASIGTNRRTQLSAALKLTSETQLVLVSMGGIKGELNADHWPALTGVHYITATTLDETTRRDITPLDGLNISYSDTLCSCDLLLTKPGYGSFTEAAGSGTPTLYVRRDEWPEQPFLADWLARHVPCRAITREQFQAGEFSQPLQQLLQTKTATTTATSGIAPAVASITSYLHP